MFPMTGTLYPLGNANRKNARENIIIANANDFAHQFERNVENFRSSAVMGILPL
jgi:hypothetical protein